MRINSELQLFIIWEKARSWEKEILEDIAQNFKVLQVMEIEWSKEYFSDNLSTFYGKKLPVGCNKEKEIGTGKFLLIIVEDESPMYVKRRTNSGNMLVNVNMFDSKEMYRTWVGGHKIHCTNNLEEVEHDIYLLTGMHLHDIKNLYDGERKIGDYKKVLRVDEYNKENL